MLNLNYISLFLLLVLPRIPLLPAWVHLPSFFSFSYNVLLNFLVLGQFFFLFPFGLGLGGCEGVLNLNAISAFSISYINNHLNCRSAFRNVIMRIRFFPNLRMQYLERLFLYISSKWFIKAQEICSTLSEQTKNMIGNYIESPLYKILYLDWIYC